ncbi:MAG: hypothetical protein GDA38_06835 [Hormoscilla sp. SP12CHS1]|nr:hypothetical protein [Hormoscilla sp. SP12CHS1]
MQQTINNWQFIVEREKTSLALYSILVVTYTTFGCTLPSATLSEMVEYPGNFSQLAWALAAVLALLLSAALTVPLRKTKRLLIRWLKTDVGMFTGVVAIVFLAALILLRIHLFGSPIVLLLAGALARLDMQTAGLSERQAFWILTVASLAGLVLGWIVNHLM